MANIYAASVDAIALVAATTKSIFELSAPSTDDARVTAVSLTFDGVTASNSPVKIELGVDDAGATTMTGTALTSANLRQNSRSTASAMAAKHTATVEGTYAPDFTLFFRVPPTSGMTWQWPLGNELFVPASAFFRIRCTAAQAVNVSFTCEWSE